MIRSLKGQFMLAILTAILFVTGSFYYIEFTSENKVPQILFYFAMIISVYNAGALTQKYMQTKK